jgi:hypothetical protein
MHGVTPAALGDIRGALVSGGWLWGTLGNVKGSLASSQICCTVLLPRL